MGLLEYMGSCREDHAELLQLRERDVLSVQSELMEAFTLLQEISRNPSSLRPAIQSSESGAEEEAQETNSVDSDKRWGQEMTQFQTHAPRKIEARSSSVDDGQSASPQQDEDEYENGEQDEEEYDGGKSDPVESEDEVEVLQDKGGNRMVGSGGIEDKNNHDGHDVSKNISDRSEEKSIVVDDSDKGDVFEVEQEEVGSDSDGSSLPSENDFNDLSLPMGDEAVYEPDREDVENSPIGYSAESEEPPDYKSVLEDSRLSISPSLSQDKVYTTAIAVDTSDLMLSLYPSKEVLDMAVQTDGQEVNANRSTTPQPPSKQSAAVNTILLSLSPSKEALDMAVQTESQEADAVSYTSPSKQGAVVNTIFSPLQVLPSTALPGMRVRSRSAGSLRLPPSTPTLVQPQALQGTRDRSVDPRQRLWASKGQTASSVFSPLPPSPAARAFPTTLSLETAHPMMADHLLASQPPKSVSRRDVVDGDDDLFVSSRIYSLPSTPRARSLSASSQARGAPLALPPVTMSKADSGVSVETQTEKTTKMLRDQTTSPLPLHVVFPSISMETQTESTPKLVQDQSTSPAPSPVPPPPVVLPVIVMKERGTNTSPVGSILLEQDKNDLHGKAELVERACSPIVFSQEVEEESKAGVLLEEVKEELPTILHHDSEVEVEDTELSAIYHKLASHMIAAAGTEQEPEDEEDAGSLPSLQWEEEEKKTDQDYQEQQQPGAVGVAAEHKEVSGNDDLLRLLLGQSESESEDDDGDESEGEETRPFDEKDDLSIPHTEEPLQENEQASADKAVIIEDMEAITIPSVEEKKDMRDSMEGDQVVDTQVQEEQRHDGEEGQHNNAGVVERLESIVEYYPPVSIEAECKKIVNEDAAVQTEELDVLPPAVPVAVTELPAVTPTTTETEAEAEAGSSSQMVMPPKVIETVDGQSQTEDDVAKAVESHSVPVATASAIISEYQAQVASIHQRDNDYIHAMEQVQFVLGESLYLLNKDHKEKLEQALESNEVNPFSSSSRAHQFHSERGRLLESSLLSSPLSKSKRQSFDSQLAMAHDHIMNLTTAKEKLEKEIKSLRVAFEGQNQAKMHKILSLQQEKDDLMGKLAEYLEKQQKRVVAKEDRGIQVHSDDLAIIIKAQRPALGDHYGYEEGVYSSVPVVREFLTGGISSSQPQPPRLQKEDHLSKLLFADARQQRMAASSEEQKDLIDGPQPGKAGLRDAAEDLEQFIQKELTDMEAHLEVMTVSNRPEGNRPEGRVRALHEDEPSSAPESPTKGDDFDKVQMEWEVQQLNKRYQVLEQQNKKLSRELELYKTKVFTIVEQDVHGNLKHALPEINLSYALYNPKLHVQEVLNYHDNLHSYQSLYILNALVENNNNHVEMIEALKHDKQLLTERNNELATDIEYFRGEITEKDEAISRLRMLLSQASSTINHSEEDYQVLQKQVQILTKKLQLLLVENQQLSSMVHGKGAMIAKSHMPLPLPSPSSYHTHSR
eukprot:scaffold12509_cov198-Ochromonas_danica.AAC.8